MAKTDRKLEIYCRGAFNALNAQREFWDPTDEDIVRYCTKSIFYSENAGQSWTDVSGNLEENVSGYGAGPSVRSVYIYPLKNGYRYFAGTSTGLYSTSTLNGTSTKWVLEGAETIGNMVVDMISGRPSDGYIAIATHGNGMYSARFNTNELSVNGNVVSSDGTTNIHPKWNPSKNGFAYLSNKSNDYFGQTSLYYFDLEKKKEEKIKSNVYSAPSWHSNGEVIFYSKKAKFPNKYGSRYYDIYYEIHWCYCLSIHIRKKQA